MEIKPLQEITSLQEMFNFSADHLLKQGKLSRGPKPPPSLHPMGSLSTGAPHLYRGLDSCKCTVGCFIPDENYLPSFERLRINHPEIDKILPTNIRSIPGYQYFLKELQYAHDGSSYWGAIYRALTELAIEFDLDPSILIGR